ncbi:hypothetical protein [Paenibacillus senegalensis]|uniref:hypothetical protein n=1 Tax=Paenibacillus senegalensis TaxID=1465766 RepID=UPI00028877F5|nr:hypothetical protein [Paenibacillus senegalensis]
MLETISQVLSFGIGVVLIFLGILWVLHDKKTKVHRKISYGLIAVIIGLATIVSNGLQLLI